MRLESSSPRRHRLRVVLAAALIASAVLAVPGHGAPPPAGDTARNGGVPGALPSGFRYAYADDFHGWPVAPIHREHPIRGAFLTPRAGGYHFGIDIAVDDRAPDPGAPPLRSHRVYAL